MLNCPAVDHSWIDPSIVGTNGAPWEFDYTYNENLGERTNTILDPNGNPQAATFKTNGSYTCSFVKKSQVRAQTLIATDDRDQSTKNDYHFLKVSTLMPPQASVDGAGEQGIPHQGAKFANMLFMDGQIITDDPNKFLNPTQDWIINFRTDPTSSFPF
jgi:prepilin-type processing-associated H-X9-DG protein